LFINLGDIYWVSNSYDMDITTNQVLLGACFTGSAVLIVGIVTAFLTYESNALATKNDHKLAVLKVLLEAAYKEYEFRTKQDIKEAKLLGNIAKIKSFTESIIFYREIADIFSKNTAQRASLILWRKTKYLLILTTKAEKKKELNIIKKIRREVQSIVWINS